MVPQRQRDGRIQREMTIADSGVDDPQAQIGIEIRHVRLDRQRDVEIIDNESLSLCQTRCEVEGEVKRGGQRQADRDSGIGFEGDARALAPFAQADRQTDGSLGVEAHSGETNPVAVDDEAERRSSRSG